MAESLYERIGGERVITAAVTLFYERVMADESLARFFADLDMGAQIDKQIAFMTMAFGGPNDYTGRDLRTAHARLVKNGLGDAHFDAISEHLAATLTELGVELTDGDERRSLSFDEFMAIPLDRRVRWLLTGRPTFFHAGMEISRREALRLGR